MHNALFKDKNFYREYFPFFFESFKSNFKWISLIMRHANLPKYNGFDTDNLLNSDIGKIFQSCHLLKMNSESLEISDGTKFLAFSNLIEGVAPYNYEKEPMEIDVLVVWKNLADVESFALNEFGLGGHIKFDDDSYSEVLDLAKG
jgi:hypothetical protein